MREHSHTPTHPPTPTHTEILNQTAVCMFVCDITTTIHTHTQHIIHELTSQAQIPSQFSSQNTPRVNRKLSRLDRVHDHPGPFTGLTRSFCSCLLLAFWLRVFNQSELNECGSCEVIRRTVFYFQTSHIQALPMKMFSGVPKKLAQGGFELSL